MDALHVGIIACLFLLLTACSRVNTPLPIREPDVVRIGVLPDQSTERLEKKYAPLVAYLKQALGKDIKLTIPANYSELSDLFHRNKLDLAWFGGLTFTQAESRSAAVPLVLRDVDLEFTSDFLVLNDPEKDTLRDYAGKRFTFGPRLSTSGHLMPRHTLHQAGIVPEEFFSQVGYTEGHDQTALWVQEGKVDIGAANSVVIEMMIKQGTLDMNKVKILDRTPPFRNYVWATPANLSPSLRQGLLDAFLALDVTLPNHAGILDAMGARYYVPASTSHFNGIREAQALLGSAISEGGS